jgi:hypothetical protein
MAWSTTLAGDAGERDTVLRLTAIPAAPAGASMYLTLGSEIVRVTGIGDKAVNVERGMLGTDTANHAAGTTVERYKSPVTLTAEAGPHVHPEYEAAPAPAPAEHPDLSAHTALGLASEHQHDFASTGHSHGTAAHVHDYAASGHAHGTAAHPHDYAATGHTHGTAAHPHDYAATVHLHADYSGTAHLHAAYSGTAHAHDLSAYSGTAHTHPGGGANVKSGVVNLPAGGSAVVTFTTPFASLPHVQVTSQFNSADTSTTLSVFPVSVSGFTIRGAGNAAGTVAWLATNAGNP